MSRNCKSLFASFKLLCLLTIISRVAGFSSLQANGGLKSCLSSSRSLEKHLYARSDLHRKINNMRMGAEGSLPDPTLRNKVTSFTSKNSFLLGMAVAVSLAKAFPSVSHTSDFFYCLCIVSHEFTFKIVGREWRPFETRAFHWKCQSQV